MQFKIFKIFTKKNGILYIQRDIIIHTHSFYQHTKFQIDSSVFDLNFDVFLCKSIPNYDIRFSNAIFVTFM